MRAGPATLRRLGGVVVARLGMAVPVRIGRRTGLRRAVGVAVLALSLLPPGCATAGSTGPDDPPLRAAVDAPERFEPPPSRARLAPSDTLPGGGCLNPMTDPRDGTEARLVRSWVRHGDYRVPTGRYGVGDGELLRLECNTGGVVGVVRR